jgi:hypothetical protein
MKKQELWHELREPLEPEDTLDQVLRTELAWQAPPELTNRLLSAVQQAATSEAGAAVAQPAPPARPHTWYTVLVSILTTLAVTLSLMVAWQFYGALGAELGIAEWWAQVQQLPAAGLAWLDTHLPALRTVVDVLGSSQEYVQWLLAAIVLWLALDGWSPASQAPQHQHASS